MSQHPPVKMIASDIDGTMIRSDHTLSPRVKAAMEAAVDAGLFVVPTTGRPHAIAHDIIEASGLDQYWIFANGAITRHLGNDELIRGFWLDGELALSLVGDVRNKLPNAGFAIELEQSLVFEGSFSKVVPLPQDQEHHDDILVPLQEAVERGDRIQKVLIFEPETEISLLHSQVSDAAGGRATACYSGLNFVEIADQMVTKAQALDLLTADLGIDRSEVAAFGDNQNDLEMLGWAGRSYAMANGTPDARNTAKEVIESNDDDGVAIKIEQILAEQF